MASLEKFMIERLVFNQIIPKEDAKLYQFGLECLILKSLHCISYLLLAACFHMLPEAIVIGCVLIPLRRNAGGYHARTKTGCYLFSCCYVALLFFLFSIGINEYIWWIAFLLSDAVIFFLCPVENENKQLDEKEVEYYRRKTRLLLMLVNFACIALTVFGFQFIGSLLRCAVCGAAPLLILGKIKKRPFFH